MYSCRPAPWNVHDTFVFLVLLFLPGILYILYIIICSGKKKTEGQTGATHNAACLHGRIFPTLLFRISRELVREFTIYLFFFTPINDFFSSRRLNDSGLAATPHCHPISPLHLDDVTRHQPIDVQRPDDVIRRHDNISPSSSSSSSVLSRDESGIVKSSADSNSSSCSPEPPQSQFDYHSDNEQQQQQHQLALSTPRRSRTTDMYYFFIICVFVYECDVAYPKTH